MGIMSINDRDRKEWAHHPVTQAFLSDLREEKLKRSEMWAAGGYTAETTDGTAQLNARAIGEVNALTEIVDQIDEWASLPTDEVERVTA